MGLSKNGVNGSEREKEKDKMEKAADRAIRNIVIEQKQRLNVNEAVLLVLQNMT